MCSSIDILPLRGCEEIRHCRGTKTSKSKPILTDTSYILSLLSYHVPTKSVFSCYCWSCCDIYFCVPDEVEAARSQIRGACHPNPRTAERRSLTRRVPDHNDQCRRSINYGVQCIVRRIRIEYRRTITALVLASTYNEATWRYTRRGGLSLASPIAAAYATLRSHLPRKGSQIFPSTRRRSTFAAMNDDSSMVASLAERLATRVMLL